MKNILQSLILVAMFAGIVFANKILRIFLIRIKLILSILGGIFSILLIITAITELSKMLTLNLFSDNLGIDTIENTLVGTGQYLILEDVFIGAEEVIFARRGLFRRGYNY